VLGFERARRLPEEEAMYWLAEIEHRERMESLVRALGQHQAYNPPSTGEGALQAQLEWQDDLDELQLCIVQEDCCHHLPLDDEFGEQFDPPGLDHWRGAPCVTGDVED
jgi:hypothetical protein